MLKRISGDIGSAFRELVEQDYFTTESNYFRTIFAASFAKLDFKMSFPEADYGRSVAVLPEMRHMVPRGCCEKWPNVETAMSCRCCGSSRSTLPVGVGYPGGSLGRGSRFCRGVAL